MKVRARIVWAVLILTPMVAVSAAADDSPSLSDLVEKAREVRFETHSAEEYTQAAATYREVLASLATIDSDELEGLDAIDARLLRGHVSTRLFEIEDIELYKVVPNRYFALWQTDNLFVRPCAQPDARVADARDELEKLPEILANARKNLTRPARTWTENAIYNAWYADLLLGKLDEVCVDDDDLKADVLAAGAPRARRSRSTPTG